MTKCYSYIRFSSEKQSQGDSLRRQLEKSIEYAEKHNLIMDESLNMMDLGLSAFKGHHIEKGALGKFLILVEKGRIEKGSFLLVESLDRLSREKIPRALNQFLSILNAGITIVTLQDERKYSPESINDGMNDLIASIAIMSRAYEESQVKQYRITSVWEKKRGNAKNQILTSKCPHWMKLNEDRTRFELIQDRAGIINRIFRMYIDGHGTDGIAKRFNQENIRPWGKAKLWGRSYIWKILRERTCIGEYQPKKFNEES